MDWIAEPMVGYRRHCFMCIDYKGVPDVMLRHIVVHIQLQSVTSFKEREVRNAILKTLNYC